MYRRYGGPEVLEWVELPDTSPGEGEIAVRVVAASLNPLDWKLREGQFKLFARGVPRGTGYDYAGVVESAGPGVATFKAGDAVVGMLDPIKAANGTLAERIHAPAALAVAKPQDVAFEDAASLPGAGIMAMQSLRQAGVKAGQRMLLVGAAGGVGSFALQLAKVAGARVTAVASGDGIDFVRPFAPERLVDYRREDWKTIPERFDVVFDASGTATFPECRRLLAPGGVAAHALPGAKLYLWSWWLALTAKERCVPVTEKADVEDLKRLVELAGAGRLRSVVSRLGRPEDVPELQRAMKAGRNRGKTVVRMAPWSVGGTSTRAGPGRGLHPPREVNDRAA
jgi:NADPH:quinone reductase-like Zn-dependent oxidoreductase